MYKESGSDVEHLEDFLKGESKKNLKEDNYTNMDEEKEGKQADVLRSKITQYDHDIPRKKGENEKALVTKEMELSHLGKNIFIGDSAATSHMTSNKMGVYDLVPIKGSVIIGNGKGISCTHKVKLDVICKHKDGSIAIETWQVKIVPELAVIAIHEGKKMRSKLDDRGKTCMFVGYADDHTKDVYRFLNIHTRRIILSRDVRWLNIIWKQYKKKSLYARRQVELFLYEEERSLGDERSFGESSIEEIEEDESESDGNNTETQKKLGIDINMIGARKETLEKTRSETKALSSPSNESMERADLTMEDWIQETCLISAVTSGPTEPKTFQEAWHYPIENERERWRIAIRKEIRSMIERGVWRKTDRKKIPNNRRLIGKKWVFKIKRDGTYRARLVALGYSQIPGVDYTDNFAPVAHDVSFRIALARMMVEKLDSLVMDVETAFLYGDIEEEIFMKSPIGMEEIDPGSSPEDCYQLKKGIYGLCQAARQFWKKFVDTIRKEPFGFTVSPADPCLLFKENNLGICIIIMYVDDMLIIGKKEQIEDIASKIQKEFSVKIQHNLADYLGCEFHMNKERTRGCLGPQLSKA